MKRAVPKVKSPLKTEALDHFLIHSHTFSSTEDICKFQNNLLSWYDKNKRSLQWRDLSVHKDPNIRAYSGSLFEQFFLIYT